VAKKFLKYIEPNLIYLVQLGLPLHTILISKRLARDEHSSLLFWSISEVTQRFRALIKTVKGIKTFSWSLTMGTSKLKYCALKI